MKKMIVLVALMAGILVGCGKGTATPTKLDGATSEPAPVHTLAPLPAPRRSVCSQSTQPVMDPAFRNLEGDKAILFVWDNSGSLEKHRIPLVEFRYRFPVFFTQALHEMAQTPGLSNLGDIKISFASLGTLNEENKLHTVVPFTPAKEWDSDSVGEQEVSHDDRPIVYRHSLEQAFKGGKMQWPSDAGGRLVVVLTDGDFTVGDDVFNKWEDMLRSEDAKVLWVLFPLPSSQRANSNRLYNYSDHNTDRQQFIVLDAQKASYETWGKVVWRRIFSMLLPRFDSLSIQWLNSVLSSDKRTTFHLPPSVRDKGGFFVLHVLGWDKEGNVLREVDPHVNGKYVGIIPPGGWSNSEYMKKNRS